MLRLTRPGFLAASRSCPPALSLPAARRSGRPRVVVVQAKRLTDAELEDSVRLRSEAEAPFRPVRLALFGFGVVSASIGLLVSLPQLIGSLGGARNALESSTVFENIAINAGFAALCGFFVYRDLEAQKLQMARLTREERLGTLPVQLANGKVIPLGRLRGTARVVITAGTPEQVKAAVDAAAPMKEELMRRGVVVVPLPLFESTSGGSPDAADLGPVPPEELRWRVTPVRLDEWRLWFGEQLALAAGRSVTSERGVFVGLRLDGRVRSSGQGQPPWQRYMMELAPVEGEGAFKGFMDGFDGKVSMWQ